VSSGASESALAARRADNADKQAKVYVGTHVRVLDARVQVDALKVWANEQINGVFIPKLRQIKQLSVAVRMRSQ
jgi:hypothetical protein